MAYGESTYGSTPYGASPTTSTAPPQPGDTTAPVFTGSLTVSAITTTSAHAAWPAATDNVAVIGYEFSCDTGTPTWLDVGTARVADPSLLSPNTSYTARARAYDAAGNRSTPLEYVFQTALDGGGTVPGPLVATVRFISLSKRRI